MRGLRGFAPAAAFVLVLALCGCEKIDRNMWDSPAFKPESDPVRLPPADSVPTKGIERIPSFAEAKALKNPVKRTEWNLLKGKELFGIFCVPCHGASGKGDGPIAKKYVPTPADIGPGGVTPHLADGELYVIISSGSGGMPAFRHDLLPTERWLIVDYLRALKQTP
ncbi:MAG: cytochrome c [Deltaproteobacteria bacterium]|nr:cytochrome c [Deltaproteobacteria bacterium]